MPVNKVKRRGSYAPLSAHYYKDDRLIRAGEKAELLYVRALAFCADVLNDGFITDAQLAHVGVGLTGVKARAKALVDVGAWERGAGGFMVVAWLSWNKSRQDILEDNRKDADRKGSQDSDQPTPPEPPSDKMPDSDPWDEPQAGRIPNGNQSKSGRTPDGVQTGSHARRPARAPSNSRAELTPELEPEPVAAVAAQAREPEQAPPQRPAVVAARLVGEVLPRTVGRHGCRTELTTQCAERLDAGVDLAVVKAALQRWVNTSRVAPGAIGYMLDDAVKDAQGAARYGARAARNTVENVTALDSFIHGLEAREAGTDATVLPLERGAS